MTNVLRTLVPPRSEAFESAFGRSRWVEVARKLTAARGEHHGGRTDQTWPALNRSEVDPRLRSVAAIATLVTFVLGQMAFALHVPYVGQLATSLFVHFGPGVVFCLVARVRERYLFGLLTVVLGPALGILIGMIAALYGISTSVVWPVLAMAVMGGLALSLVLQHLEGRRPLASPAAAASNRTSAADHATDVTSKRVLPGILSVAGGAVAVGAGAAHHGVPHPGGAAINAGVFWFVGAAVALLGLTLAWRWRRSLLVPVLVVTTLVVTTQAAMYGEPTVDVSGRHIGIVEYLLSYGRLDLSTDIYQAWSGLFALSALNAHAAHVAHMFTFAAWWPVAGSIAEVLAVRYLAGLFLDYRRAWLAALVFGLAGSLNTVFFAPQVIGFAMAFTALGVALSPARAPLRLAPVARYTIISVLSVALAVTHQISPYMLVLSMTVLVAFGLLRPWWLPAVVAAPSIAWALINQHLLTRFVSISDIGNLFTNLSPPDNSTGSFAESVANRVTFGVPAADLVVVGLVALLKLWMLRGRTLIALAAAAASPVVLMAGTAYGNEGVFRVALFALPWLAIMACMPVVRPTGRRAPRWLPTLGVVLLFVCYVVGTTGMDPSRVIRPDDVAATTWVEMAAPADSLVLCLGTDATTPYDSTARYAETTFLYRKALYDDTVNPYPTVTGTAYDAQADLAQLTKRFLTFGATRHYALISDSMGIYDQAYGNQRASDSRQLAAAIAQSRQWRVVYTSGDTAVYQLVKEPRS